MTDPPGSDADVVVVGGGPAGSTVARLLAGMGHAVLLVDRARFPRAKPCGECLNPGAVHVLAELGLLQEVTACGPARIGGWRIEGGRRPVRGEFGGGLQGLGLTRRILDATLLAGARARGVDVIEGVRVESVTEAADHGRPRVALREGSRRWSLRPRIVVGADGLRSRVARCIGGVSRVPGRRKVSYTWHVSGLDPEPSLRGLGTLVLRDGLTLGLAPVDADMTLWNATLVLPVPGATGPRHPPTDLLFRAVESSGVSGTPALVDGPLTSGPFDWPARRTWAPGVVLVGDAAGYFDPLTGQGIFRALHSARMAAAAVARSLGSPQPDWRPLAGYGTALRRSVAPTRRVQRLTEAIVSRAGLRHQALRCLERAGTAGSLFRVTGDAAPVRSLVYPAIRTVLRACAPSRGRPSSVVGRSRC